MRHLSRTAAPALFVTGTVSVVAGSAHAAPDHEWRIIITEIMYNPASEEGQGQAEWVEIANLSAEPVVIKDWRLDDEDDNDWGRFSCTIEPGGIVVLVNGDAVKESGFRAAWELDYDSESAREPTYQVIGVKWGSLANSPSGSNEILQLLDEHDDIVCEVNYRSGDGWPDVSRPDGASIWLNDLRATDLNKGELWTRSEDGLHGARKAIMTPIFSAGDVGSPGYVEGLSDYVEHLLSIADTAASDDAPTEEPDDDPLPDPDPDSNPDSDRQ